MQRSLLAMLLALGVIALTVSLAAASIEPAREPAAGAAQPDRTSPAPNEPNVPSCVFVGPLGVRWTLNAPMPTARHSLAVVAPSGQTVMYAIGGLQGWANAVAANERFNACSNTWQALAPLPAPRGYIQAAELNGMIYVVGGVDQVVSGTFGVQRNVWVYHPTIDFWKTAADLPQALGGVAVAAADGKLYAFGGFDSRGPGAGDVNAVYEYEPGPDRWNLQPSMPLGARSLAAAAELNGKIYVGGGVSGSLYGIARNEVYDLDAHTWGTAHSLSYEHYGFSLFSAPDGYLYALGGSHASNDGGYATSRYDPVADAWSSISDLQINDSFSHGLSGGAYTAGRVFLLGGIGMRYGIPGFQEQMSNVNESVHILESWCESSIQAQPPSSAPGERITYTIELRGEVTSLPNVILLDPIPGGTTFEGFVGDPSGAQYNTGENQVKWQGPLPANPTPITITFSVRVNIAGWTNGRFITNTLAIHNGLNMLGRSTGTWIDAFDLSTSGKRVNRNTAVTGDVLTYTVRVQSNSPTSGTATLIDPIPLNTNYLTGSLTGTLGAARYDAGKIVWNGQLIPHTAVYTNPGSDYQWGDSRGNGVVPGVKYDWIEIKDTGERYQFTEPDNAGCYHTAFPFDFTFYTSVYTKAAASTNGTLYFIDDWTGVTYAMSPDNSPLPGNNFYKGYSFGRFLAPFWDDLYMLPGKIYHQVFGVAPNRKVVIEWGDVTRRDGSANPGGPGSFEMIVFEGSSAVQFQYKDVDFGNPAYDNGASASVGMQSDEKGLQYAYDTPSISDRLAILIVPPKRSITYTANFADITFAVTPNGVLPDRTPITNTATISSSTGQVITREAVTLYGAPDFSESYLTSRQSIVQAGDSIDYDLHVINRGPVDGFLQLTDIVQHEPWLYYWLGSLDYPFGHGTDTNGIVEWTGLVPAVSSATIHFGASVNFDPTGQPPISNTATLTNVATGAVYQRSVILDQPKLADLFVASSGPGTIESTAPFTYTIAYGNAGPFDGEYGPLITDILPAGVSFVSVSPGGRQISPNTVVWDFSPLTAETTHTLTVTVALLDAPLGAVLTNTVTISDMAQDPDWSNDSHQWFTRVGAAPNLLNGTAKHAAWATAGANPVLAYTILINNTGSLTAATTITDPLPSGLSYQSGSSTVDGVSIELYDAASNSLKWIGSIDVGAAITLRYRASITASSGSAITNTATINDGTFLTFERSAVTPLWRQLFLPLVRR